MSVIASAVKHMLAAGMAHDAIVAAIVEMEMAGGVAAERRLAEKRAKDAERQRLSRANRQEKAEMSRDVTECHSDICDAPSPNDNLNPIPKEKPPYGGQKESPSEPDQTEAALSEFNRVAARVSWPKAQKLTSDRRAKLRLRLNEAGGLPGWTAALERAARSPVLTGDNNRNWRASIDFFLQPSSFLKLIEGNYDDKRSRPQAELFVAPQDQDRSWSNMLVHWKRGTWSTYWGPEPGQPGCKIPPAFVSNWQARTTAQGANAA